MMTAPLDSTIDGSPVVDRAAIRTFCTVLFGYAEGFVPIRVFAEKGGPDLRRETPFVPSDGRLAEAVARAAERAAQRRAALYVVPGTVARAGRAGAADILQLTTVLVDLDEGDVAAKRTHLVQYLGEPSLAVTSGGITAEGQAKLHLYWALTEPASGADIALVCRLRGDMASKVGGDPSFVSPHQPIRVPGSVYGKHGARRPVRIVAQRQREVDLREFTEAVDAMPALPGLNGVVEPTRRARANAGHLLTQRVREGGIDGTTRFDAVSRVAGYWIRRAREGRCSLASAREEVAAYNLACLDPPWPERRLRDEFERLLALDQRNHGGIAGPPAPEGGNADREPGDTVPPPLSEDALARAFAERHADDWKHVASWGAWLGWDGRRWRMDDVGRHRELVRQVCRSGAITAEKVRDAQRLASRKTMAAVEQIARADPRHAARPEDWDANPTLLNTLGGIVDLATGETRPHDRAARLTRLTSARPAASCPRWRAFIDEIAGGDGELASYLQRVAGYCLAGRNPEQVMFFLHGSGANGKSVFASVLAAVLGDYATTAPLETFMAAHGERHPTDLAGLRGARLVIVTETEPGRHWAESRLKAVTGGDRIKARFMRQDFFEFEPQFKLVIIGNHKPALRSPDEAIRRRLHLVPFAVTIPPAERDPTLLQKLQEERDGILGWALEGCADLQRGGLAPPPVVVTATREYFEDEDTIGEWLAECCRPAEVVTRTRDLFRSWSAYSEGAGTAIATQKALKSELRKRGYRDGRTPSGQRGVGGIALRVLSADGGAP